MICVWSILHNYINPFPQFLLQNSCVEKNSIAKTELVSLRNLSVMIILTVPTVLTRMINFPVSDSFQYLSRAMLFMQERDTSSKRKLNFIYTNRFSVCVEFNSVKMVMLQVI